MPARNTSPSLSPAGCPPHSVCPVHSPTLIAALPLTCATASQAGPEPVQQRAV